MTIPEKVSYIKGLAEGLQLGESKEEKLLKEIIGVLEDIALAIDDIDTTCAEIGEQVDAVDEDLAAVEDFLLDEEDYYDNIPENLQYSQRAEDSEAAIDSLEEALDLLNEVYNADEFDKDNELIQEAIDKVEEAKW